MLWCSHDFGQNLWLKLWHLCSVRINRSILSGQYMTLQPLMPPMSTNILAILANFLDTIVPFFWKTSVMTDITNNILDSDWFELGRQEKDLAQFQQLILIAMSKKGTDWQRCHRIYYYKTHLSVDYPCCTLASWVDNDPSHMGHPVPAGAWSKMEWPVNWGSPSSMDWLAKKEYKLLKGQKLMIIILSHLNPTGLSRQLSQLTLSLMYMALSAEYVPPTTWKE